MDHLKDVSAALPAFGRLQPCCYRFYAEHKVKLIALGVRWLIEMVIKYFRSEAIYVPREQKHA